jgi:hypothetical protein
MDVIIMIKIRAKTYRNKESQMETFSKVKNPAAVFDKADGTLLKIGEKEFMEDYYKKIQGVYRQNGFHHMADDIVMIDLPKDQEIIDKVFQITGYIKRFYEKNIN